MTKTDFCKSLEWRREITWTGLTGLTKLDDERLAKIELATRSRGGEYPGFLVTILNKTEGKVDSTYFRFDDHLDGTLESRTDGRKDYPMGKNKTYHVASSCGWDWYIATPKSTRLFCEAIEGYIGAFA